MKHSSLKSFVSNEVDKNGNPISTGDFIHLKNYQSNKFSDAHAIEKAQNLVKLATEHLEKPAVVLQLAPIRVLNIKIDGENWKDSFPDEKNPPPGFMVSQCNSVVDASSLVPPNWPNGAASSVLRVNGCVPFFFWFRSLNFLLMSQKAKLRVIPFPIIQEKKEAGETKEDNSEIVYQAIISTLAEYDEYQKSLTEMVNSIGFEKGFAMAGRYGYAVYLNRARSEHNEENDGPFNEEKALQEHELVDKYLTQIIIMKDSCLKGVLIEGADRELFDDQDFQTTNKIFL